jgi:hypothetical protein
MRKEFHFLLTSFVVLKAWKKAAVKASMISFAVNQEKGATLKESIASA